MRARFLPFRAGPFDFVDVGDDPILEAEIRDRMRHFAAGAVMARGRGEEFQCREYRPKRLRGMHQFAVYKGEELYGCWGLLAMRTSLLSRGLWEASTEMLPGMPHVFTPRYWMQVAGIANYMLTHPLPLIGGGRLELTEWIFPSVDRGDDPVHQWTGPEIRALTAELGRLDVDVTRVTREHPTLGNSACMDRVRPRRRPVAFGVR